jgi:hypothetical protein
LRSAGASRRRCVDELLAEARSCRRPRYCLPRLAFCAPRLWLIDSIAVLGRVVVEMEELFDEISWP